MFEALSKNLEKKGYCVSVFETGAEAAAYLNRQIDGCTVGFGGSMTLQQIGLHDLLAAHNTVYNHWVPGEKKVQEILPLAAAAQVYVTSVNAVAETGELVNIDGNGNRVSAALFGHKKVYFVAGANKLAPTLDEAIWRARNVAAPKNAQRLGRKTPCAKNADKCYDCTSPDRICCGLCVHYQKMHMADMEVVLIKEPLGY